MDQEEDKVEENTSPELGGDTEDVTPAEGDEATDGADEAGEDETETDEGDKTTLA